MNGRREWGVWGIGPRIVIVTMGVYLAILVATWLVPSLRFSDHRPLALGQLAWLLIIAGIVIWFLAVRRLRAAYAAGYLETTGMFAWVRNPIYSAFIFIECPGLALALWAWPAISLPFVAYVLYVLWIPAEEDLLLRRFGAHYEVYRRRVPGLVPRPPAWQRRGGPGAGPPGPGAGGGRGSGRGSGARRSRSLRRGTDRSKRHLRGL